MHISPIYPVMIVIEDLSGGAWGGPVIVLAHD